MGGRGESSYTSKLRNRYGSQYHTLLTDGNIKFVEKNGRGSETLMETMTPGRVYVHVENGELKSIVYFDKSNKRSKQIDLDHVHRGERPHTHHGYFHNENDSKKGAARMTPEEARMVESVRRIWEDRRRGK